MCAPRRQMLISKRVTGFPLLSNKIEEESHPNTPFDRTTNHYYSNSPPPPPISFVSFWSFSASFHHHLIFLTFFIYHLNRSLSLSLLQSFSSCIQYKKTMVFLIFKSFLILMSNKKKEPTQQSGWRANEGIRRDQSNYKPVDLTSQIIRAECRKKETTGFCSSSETTTASIRRTLTGPIQL